MLEDLLVLFTPSATHAGEGEMGLLNVGTYVEGTRE